MSACPPQARDLLSAYLDEEVTPAERRLVEQHLTSCAECRELLDRTRALVSLLAQAPIEAAPQGFALGVRDRIDRPGSSSRFRWRPWMTAVTSMAALFVGVAIGLQIFHRESGVRPLPRMNSLDFSRAEKTEAKVLTESEPTRQAEGSIEAVTALESESRNKDIVEKAARSTESLRREANAEGAKAEGGDEGASIEQLEDSTPAVGNVLNRLRDWMGRADAVAASSDLRNLTMDSLEMESANGAVDWGQKALPVEPGLFFYVVQSPAQQQRARILLEQLGADGVQTLSSSPSSGLIVNPPANVNAISCFDLQAGQYVLATFPDSKSLEQFSQAVSIDLSTDWTLASQSGIVAMESGLGSDRDGAGSTDRGLIDDTPLKLGRGTPRSRTATREPAGPGAPGAPGATAKSSGVSPPGGPGSKSRPGAASGSPARPEGKRSAAQDPGALAGSSLEDNVAERPAAESSQPFPEVGFRLLLWFPIF